MKLKIKGKINKILYGMFPNPIEIEAKQIDAILKIENDEFPVSLGKCIITIKPMIGNQR